MVYFTNKGHLENFIKYLTRTDWNQKWTNEQTVNCLFAVRGSDGRLSEIANPGTGSREYIRSAIRAALYGLSYSALGNDILAVGDYHGGEDDEDIDESKMSSLSQEECEEVFRDLMKELDADDTILAMVMHNDQDYGGDRIDNHIHRIIRLPEKH